MTSKQADDRLIKKYPNRRLYDTQTSAYITLLDVKQLVLDQASFRVVDAKSGEDLTRTILLQIILDEESGGMPMFSSMMLSQVIRFYGNAMQGMMGNYLERNIQTFIDAQQAFSEQMRVPLTAGATGLQGAAHAAQGGSTANGGNASNNSAAANGNPNGSPNGAGIAGGAAAFMPLASSPLVQNLMNGYMDQSRELFLQMQEHLRQQSQAFLSGFPYKPAPPPPSTSKSPPTASSPDDD